MMHEVGVHRRRMLTDRLSVAQGDDALPGGVALDVLTGQLVGALFYRRFIGRQGRRSWPATLPR